MIAKKLTKIVLPVFIALGSQAVQSVGVEGNKVTAVDQSKGTNADVEITRQIRERLVADESLSVQAQNLTVVTLGKNVTVRGSVESSRERQTVKDHIRAVVSNARIDEKALTVIAPPSAR